jgi:hypothetical protein
MPQPLEAADLPRKDVLRWGLVGAPVLILGSGHSSHAGDMPGVEQGAEGGRLEHFRLRQNPRARCHLSARLLHAHD